MVGGTYLNGDTNLYMIFVLDIKSLTWKFFKALPGGTLFQQSNLQKGSWNTGLVWTEGNAFVVLGNPDRNLRKDHEQLIINATHVCEVKIDDTIFG